MILLSCFLNVLHFPAPITATSLTTDLIAYYSFDGDANDGSGNGHHAVVHSVFLSTDRFGVANTAYGFDGSTPT